jgi:hypothetical protein
MGEVIPVSTTQLSHTEVLTQITNSYPWNQTAESLVAMHCRGGERRSITASLMRIKPLPPSPQPITLWTALLWIILYVHV